VANGPNIFEMLLVSQTSEILPPRKKFWPDDADYIQWLKLADGVMPVADQRGQVAVLWVLAWTENFTVIGATRRSPPPLNISKYFIGS